jgi:hypothetical protein
MARFSRGTLHSVLLIPLLVYLLLPLFGAVWHDLIPEHDHWLLAQPAAPDSLASHLRAESRLCDACRQLVPGMTLLHAFDPISALQVFGIVLGLIAAYRLIRPNGLSSPVVFPALFVRAPQLAPLEPPPLLTANHA